MKNIKIKNSSMIKASSDDIRAWISSSSNQYFDDKIRQEEKKQLIRDLNLYLASQVPHLCYSMCDVLVKKEWVVNAQ